MVCVSGVTWYRFIHIEKGNWKSSANPQLLKSSRSLCLYAGAVSQSSSTSFSLQSWSRFVQTSGTPSRLQSARVPLVSWVASSMPSSLQSSAKRRSVRSINHRQGWSIPPMASMSFTPERYFAPNPGWVPDGIVGLISRSDQLFPRKSHAFPFRTAMKPSSFVEKPRPNPDPPGPEPWSIRVQSLPFHIQVSSRVMIRSFTLR